VQGTPMGEQGHDEDNSVCRNFNLTGTRPSERCS
jgi:hypothetical protein